jgi:ketosteroid isomerase-like protein
MMKGSRLITTNKELVTEYFNRISKRDLDGLLDLFAEDATLYEPFSSENGLHGISEIESFMRVAFMANAGLQKEITFPAQKKEDEIVANIVFKRGDTIRGRFTFKTIGVQERAGVSKKIKTLKIEFLH